MEEKIFEKTSEISVIAIINELKKRKWTLLVFTLIGWLGLGIYMLFPKQYTYEIDFLITQRNQPNQHSILGNSGILSSDGLYMDINIPEGNSTYNSGNSINPNSFDNVLNADSALIYFGKQSLPNSKYPTILDSLKEKLITKKDIDITDPDIMHKFLGKKIFVAQYSSTKNIVSIYVTSENKSLSKLLSTKSIEYLNYYIQSIQNHQLNQELSLLETAVKDNKEKLISVTDPDTQKLYKSFISLLTKQLYECKIRITLAQENLFTLLSGPIQIDKNGLIFLILMTTIVALAIGSIWVIAKKFWKDAIANNKNN